MSNKLAQAVETINNTKLSQALFIKHKNYFHVVKINLCFRIIRHFFIVAQPQWECLPRSRAHTADASVAILPCSSDDHALHFLIFSWLSTSWFCFYCLFITSAHYLDCAHRGVITLQGSFSAIFARFCCIYFQHDVRRIVDVFVWVNFKLYW